MQKITDGQPADVLALAWYHIGYPPLNSVIVVGLHNGGRTTGVIVRIDLPPPQARVATLAHLAAIVRESGADGAVVVLVADLPAGTVEAFNDTAGEVLDRAGLDLYDLLHVTDDSYRSVHCKDPACCPAEGFPLASIHRTRTARLMLAEGHRLLSCEADLIADVEPVPPPRAGSAARLAAQALDPDQWLTRWRAALEDPALDPDECAAASLRGLAEAMADPRLRDAVIFSLVPGSGTVPEQLLHSEPPEMPDLLTTPPEEALLARGTELLAAIARSAPPPARAEALAVLAWTAWWSGEGPRARLLVERVLEGQPKHRLARLVRGLLATLAPPPWRSERPRGLEDPSPPGEPRPERVGRAVGSARTAS